MKIKLFYIIFLITLSGFNPAIAQKPYFDTTMVNYKVPPGFIDGDITEKSYMPYAGSGDINIDFTIKPVEDDILIGFYFFNTTMPGVDYSKFRYIEDNVTRIVNSLIGIPRTYDSQGGINTKKLESMNSKIITLFKGKKLKAYNADYAGIFDVPVQIPFYSYKRCKIFFMYKKSLGEVWKYYFFNDGTDIDSYLKKTEFLTSFK